MRKTIIDAGWKKIFKSSLGRTRIIRVADGVKWLITAAILSCVTTMGWAEESEADLQIDFNIPQQRADLALTEFAEQADLTLAVPRDMLRGKEANALVGSYTLQEGVDLLLAGTGLIPEFSNRIVLSIKTDPKSVGVGKTMKSPKKATGLAAVLASIFVGGASAQELRTTDGDGEEFPEELEEIIVTGTNIRGVQNPTVPVIEFDREDIDLSGATTVEDFLRVIPQNFGAITPVSFDSANENAPLNRLAGTSVDLRGLGAGSTLTLLNGRRMAASGNGSFVDVSVLPLGAIERIDVLTDGASAIYGTDAVAGVVNFVTRKDFEGLELSADYGTVSDGSAENYTLSGSGGHAWSNGGALLGLEYVSTTPLQSGERDFFNADLVNPNGTLGAESERYSAFASLNQKLNERLGFSVDALLSNRETNSVANFDSQFEFRGEQNSTFVNARLDFYVTDDVTATLFYDFGLEESESSDSGGDGFDPVSAENTLHVIEGQVSGAIIDMPSGESIGFALGAGYREEEYVTSGTGFVTGPFSREVTSVYGEVLVPIVGDANPLPLIKRLNFSLAGRYEDYSDFGSTFNPKIGLAWDLGSGISIRGSYSSSFRAPSLIRSFDRQTVIVAQLPNFFITAFTPPPQSPAATFPNSTITVQTAGGNPDLREETADIWAAGIEISPESVPGLTVSASYFSIGYEDRVENIGAADLFRNPALIDFVDLNPDVQALSELFTRGESGDSILFINSFGFAPDDIQVVLNGGSQNVSERDVEGLDFNAEYFKDTSAGLFSWSLNAVYLTAYKGQLTPQSDPFDDLNTLYRPLELRVRSGVSWRNNGFGVAGYVNYSNEYDDDVDRSIANSIDDWATFDMNLSYETGNSMSAKFLNNFQISLNVRNLFDEEPPFVETLDGFNYDTTNSDVLGRYITLGLRKSF